MARKRKRKPYVPLGKLRYDPQPPRVVPPAHVRADAERRRQAWLDRGPIEELLGVPAKGYSALDQRSR